FPLGRSPHYQALPAARRFPEPLCARDEPNEPSANKRASCRPCVAWCVVGTRSQSLTVCRALTRLLVGTTCAFHHNCPASRMPISTFRLLSATIAPIYSWKIFYSSVTVEVRLDSSRGWAQSKGC